MASVKPLKLHNSNFTSVTRGAPPTLRPYYLWVVVAVDCWTVPHFLRLSISSYTHCNYKTEIHHIRVLLEFLSISKYVLHLYKNVENKKQKTPALPNKILWSYYISGGMKVILKEGNLIMKARFKLLYLFS